MDSGYISLQEAAKYCNYSQEYLSLRARQGKLKAVKFGRNWVTKKEWLDEYLEKAEEYNNNFKAKNSVASPKNLPVADYEFGARSIKSPAPIIRFGFVTALVFVVLIAGIFYGSESFKVVYRDASPFVQEFSGGFDRGVAEVFETVSSYTYIVGEAGDIIVEGMIRVAADTISDIPQSLSCTKLALVRGFVTVSGDIDNAVAEISLPEISMPEISLPEISVSEWFSSQTKEIVQNYLTANKFVEEKIFYTYQNFTQGYRAITELFKKPEKIVEEKLIPKPGEEGMVIIPSSEKDEEVKEKIKEAFSDEVKVEPKDKTSGIIIPIFREGEGQKYLYILVPVSYEQ